MNKTKQFSKMENEETLKERLFYVLTNCPLFAGQSCTSKTGPVKRVKKHAAVPKDDAALVSLHVSLPYKLRREALAAGINCSELMRKALKRYLKKAGRI